MKIRKFRYFVGDFETTVFDGQEDTEVWATLYNFRMELSGWNKRFQDTLNDWIDKLIAEYGEDVVAQMLYEGRQNGLVIT